MPAAEPTDVTGTADPTALTIDDLKPLGTRPDPLAQAKEDTRKSIASHLVLAYIALLAFSIVIPMILLLVPHAVSNAYSISDARDLMLAMSGTLSGLVGILGFVMGYYFKELDKSATPPPGSQRKKKK